MLTPRSRRIPALAGFTLLEMIVALAVGGVVLALVSTIAFRQQRFFAAFGDMTAVNLQLGETAAILPIDLRGISSVAGDIRAGEARDSSLEFRATIGAAVVCDTMVGGVVLAPAVRGSAASTAFATPPQTGDTAWILSVADSVERWVPHRVAASGATSGGACVAGGPVVIGDARTYPRMSLALESGAALRDVIAMPMRITRPVRYSLYRSSDGSWYLGERDWNNASQKFNTIQPVAGPFLSASSGGLSFRYVDSLGAAVPPGASDTRSIALVQITLRSQTAHVVRAPGFAVAANGRHVDSIVAAVFLRNRR
jgi:prepilin-type N-terminal cleavage/methylation domain-containing protein